MHERALQRAAAVAATAFLLTAGVAVADTVPADGDDVTAGVQDFFEIGPIGTGGTVNASIWFGLECNTDSHVDVGQSVVVGFGVPDVPDGGAATGSGTTVGPVPTGWPADGFLCPAGTAPLRSATPATVTLTAPDEPGVYDYIVNFTWALSPAGAGDALALRGLSRVFFELTVVPDAAPSLVLPAALTVEGDAPGGAVVRYAVGASDPEDSPPPTPVCAPASGSFFALGETTVDCTVADSAGHSVAGAFTVSVVDTTPPVFGGAPSSVALSTSDPAGANATYTPPTASDAVDPSPTVSCLPAPGDPVPVGTTTVVCRAADASHNVATVTFPLSVTYVAPATAPATVTATFDPPIGRRDAVVSRVGRTVPVKARLLRDGVQVRSGHVDLVLAECATGAAIGSPRPLTWRGQRWTLDLRTTGLAGCVRGTVRLDGVAAGSFDLRLQARPASAVLAAAVVARRSVGPAVDRTAGKDAGKGAGKDERSRAGCPAARR